MLTCTRRIQFCAGHRVMGHENKCAHLHGHNYIVFVTAKAALDAIGRVIDFSVLKQRIGGWIEAHWDHGFILSQRDAGAIALMYEFEPREGTPQKVYLMPSNPTAENMAAYLRDVVCPDQLEGTGVRVTKVVVWETENCYAQADDE